MPRHSYIGKQSKDTDKRDRYFETVVQFDEIYNNPKMEKIHKPNYQGALIEKKIEAMVEEYLENPLFLRSKNRIIIGCLGENWYIVDGQHRVEMARQLYQEQSKNDTLVFCWYECANEQDMRGLFNSLNQDSIKNKFYIQTQDFTQIVVLEFIRRLKTHCKPYFAGKKTENGRLMAVEECVAKLRSIHFFDQFKDSQQAYTYLREKNNEFYEINRYRINFQENKTMFYVEEGKNIAEGIIFPLKRNNFIKWLEDPKNPPIHYSKKSSKDRISPYKKSVVWKRQFGESVEGKCPISFCTRKLRRVKNGWQCGHIVSEHNGGPTEPSNLKPICGECNSSMGRMNWNDWDPIS
jgi:hypothetical protein